MADPSTIALDCHSRFGWWGHPWWYRCQSKAAKPTQQAYRYKAGVALLNQTSMSKMRLGPLRPEGPKAEVEGLKSRESHCPQPRLSNPLPAFDVNSGSNEKVPVRPRPMWPSMTKT